MPGNKLGLETKERILKAAEQVFIEKGYDGTKMSDIAAQAHTSKVMLYYHFSAKQVIFASIVARMSEEIQAALNAKLNPADLSDPRSMESLLRVMLHFYAERRGLLRLIVAEYFKHPDSSVQGLGIFGNILRLVSGKGEADGRVSPESLARLFFFNAMPMLAYVCLAEEFNADFGLRPERCETLFLESFMKIYAISAGTPCE